MFGSTILDVCVGMVFLYVVFSLFCSAVNEWILRVFSVRANFLREGIRGLLDPEGADTETAKLYNHPLVRSYFRPNWKKKPTLNNLPDRVFAQVLLATVAPDAKSREMTDDLREAIASGANDHLKCILLPLIDPAGKEIRSATAAIEEWYHSAMDEVTHWYKRRTQWIILALAAAVCTAINVDTIMMADRIYHDSILRAGLVAVAVQTAPADSTDASHNSSAFEAEFDKLGLKLGWSSDVSDPRHTPRNMTEFWQKLFGLMISVVAVSLGAPFWFDVLNKLLAIRKSSTGGGAKSEDKEKS